MNINEEEFIDPDELKIGKVYIVSKDTPLMPHYDPPDPVAALLKALEIKSGGGIGILERKEHGVSLWYRVAVKTKDSFIQGWINRAALAGQKLKMVKLNV